MAWITDKKKEKETGRCRWRARQRRLESEEETWLSTCDNDFPDACLAAAAYARLTVQPGRPTVQLYMYTSSVVRLDHSAT